MIATVSSVTYLVAAVGYYLSRDGHCPTPAFPECMTTRSGKPYKKPTMEEMQGMLKLLAEDRRRIERRRNSD